MADKNLTNNELRALCSCLNYDEREAQLSDNYSNGGPTSFQGLLGWNEHQVDALIGSLEKKGMGKLDKREHEGPDMNRDRNMWIFWLSDEAVNHIFDLLDAGKIDKPAL